MLGETLFKVLPKQVIDQRFGRGNFAGLGGQPASAMQCDLARSRLLT